ncbi:MAG: hypothetical protein GTN93_21495 [Anaerolineae bacterium]|nr:hypothetical protein [Anaerolineae bacterium]
MADWLAAHLSDERPQKQLTNVCVHPATFHTALPKREEGTLHLVITDNPLFPHVDQIIAKHKWRDEGVQYEKDVLVLRDPYNCFASCIKRWGVRWAEFSWQSQIWKNLAKMAVSGEADGRGYVVCLFDRWYTEKPYREGVSKQMDLKHTDDGFGIVRQPSSFEEFARDHRKLHLFDRWQEFKDNEKYRSLFDDEVHALAQKLWPDIGEIRRQIW